MGDPATDSFMNLMTAGARAATGETPKSWARLTSVRLTFLALRAGIGSYPSAYYSNVHDVGT